MKTIQRIGIFLLALLAVCFGYDVLAQQRVVRNDSRVSRNADGILHGAEERDLGPADAPVAVLLVHGFIGAGNNFNELPERLAEHGWRVRVMRLPGHGTSPIDFKDTTPAELLEAVVNEIRALKESHSTIILVSHSMGATLCTLAAAQVPVDGLVLAAPYFRITRHWYYLLPPETWARLLGPVVPWLPKSRAFIQVNRDEAKDQIVSYQWVHAHSTRTLIELGRHARQPAVLNAVTCPVLLMHSRGDVAASLEAANDALQHISSKDKTALTLDASNHHLFWDYDRELVMTETIGFIKRIANDLPGKED